MARQRYKVEPYSIDGLCDLLSVHSKAGADVVRAKQHVGYFREYFDHIGCRSIVVELEYVDRDYLEDFAAYYVRCFEGYPRFCVRLHFFAGKFGAAKFKRVLLHTRSTAELGLYLGFVVVRPLPETIIGRTCLATYEPENGRRYYPAIRTYDVNLFGISLQVSTLAFQEQDQVVAACATSALWSGFQATARLFQHPIYSPVTMACTPYT